MLCYTVTNAQNNYCIYQWGIIMGIIRSWTLALSPVIFLVLSCTPQYSVAADLIDQSGNLFIFQQKLARKGNPQAQYRLAFMYETGQGVKVNQTKAIQWYTTSAKQGNRLASHRLAYLKAKLEGYSEARDKKWIDEVKRDAFTNKPEEMFLLAQLYHEGIGVKKDLNKSLKLMSRLSSEGMVAADSEVENLQAEIKANNAIKKHQQAVITKKQPVIKTAKPVIAKSIEKKAKVADKAEATRQQERKSYEAVMRRIAKQQSEIDKLQGWTEGKKKASVDDEL